MIRLKTILQYKYIYYISLILTMLLVFLRINYFKIESKLVPSNTFEGTITNIKYKNQKYTIHIKNIEEVIGYYQSEDILNIKIGDKVKIEGTMYEPMNNTIPNTFNYRKYLSNQKIFYLFKIKNIKLISKNKNIIYNIKNFIIDRSNTYKQKGYLKAFIIGDKTDLEDYLLFQENGVSHLFALSGMHIGLLTLILNHILKRIKNKNIIIISFLIIYLLITNNSASLIRSILFFITLALNKKYDLEIETKNILIITIIILLIYNPFYIYDYGFLYSILVTYGLIISTKYYHKNYIYNLIITSLVAFLFSLPITVSLNYEINLLSIINNLIIVPLISLIIYPLSIIVFIFKFLEPLFNNMVFILEKVNSILSIISLKIIIPKTNIFIVLIYYLLLLLVIKTNNFKYILLNLLIIIIIKTIPLINNNTNIFFLDVGQGDSTLITHQNEVILIDTGGVLNKTISQNTIKLIKSLGYNHIDLMLLTHGDQDHMLDAKYIIKNIIVKNVMINNNEINELEKNLLKMNPHLVKKYHKKLNISIYNNYIGDDENSSSIICLLRVGKHKLLFLGDADKEEEIKYLKEHGDKINIIKLAHHGSKTSSGYDFLKTISPQNAIISSGRNNLYHHPNKETIDTLEKLNIKYYNTQNCGTIYYKFRLNNYKISLFPPYNNIYTN